MGFRFSSCSFIFYVLLLLTKSIAKEITERGWGKQSARGDDYLRITDKQGDHIANDGHLQMIKDHVHDHQSVQIMNPMDPAFKVYFHLNGLKAGKQMPIYFPIRDSSKSPQFLPREEADWIPFSSSQLPSILDFFSFSKDSKQAKAMADTLMHCEFEPLRGERKFCATSLESMLDSAREIFGPGSQLRLLTTTHVSDHKALLQNYTILEVPKEIVAPRILACHTVPYPYAVFYCHSQESDNRLFQVSLAGENGERVEAAAICHMDTSQWDPDHVSFRVLGTKPGGSPVCHFFPADNLVWVPSP